MQNRDERIRRLKFQSSKRGLLEAELILRPFAERHLSGLPDSSLADYEKLLALEDLDLWELISGRRGSPKDINPDLIELIRGFLPAGKQDGNK